MAVKPTPRYDVPSFVVVYSIIGMVAGCFLIYICADLASGGRLSSLLDGFQPRGLAVRVGGKFERALKAVPDENSAA